MGCGRRVLFADALVTQVCCHQVLLWLEGLELPQYVMWAAPPPFVLRYHPTPTARVCGVQVPAQIS